MSKITKLKEAMKYQEKFLDGRIADAKALAGRIATGKAEGEDEIEMTYRMFLSEQYRMPVFDSYFDERTFDELAFEVYLIKARQEPIVENVSETISQNLKEAAAASEQGWEEIDSNAEEIERMAKFMETGQFEGEQPKEEVNENQ